MSSVEILMGTGGFGVSWSKNNIGDLTKALEEYGINRVDTAALYPVHASGTSERLLGEADYVKKGFVVDSKIMYSGDGKGTLTPSAVEKSLSQSLESLRAPSLNVLYCHGPDKSTPIAEQAAAFDAEFRKGRFQQLGVCNLSPEMLEEWLNIASEKGYIKPSVFQGQYSLLCRAYETTLFPLLRKHHISFIAFSPLAGGFLTGKLTQSVGPEDLKGTRFEVSQTNFMGMGFRYWYDKPSMHTAIKEASEVCNRHAIKLSDAAWRWILFHSALVGEFGDAVIIGPSNLNQLAAYVDARKQGPLEEELVGVLNGLWEGVKEDAGGIVVH